MIWFTSDTHFNHANVIKYSKRPFGSLEEMTEHIIENWNAIVGRGDIVFHLGDFSLSCGKRDSGAIDKTLGRLKGQKWLIVGNHDREEVIKNPRWHKVTPYHELKTMSGQDRLRIVLCHYPMRSWNQMHYGSWMLHGHCHGNLPKSPGKIVDVGVDCWEYRPVSLDTLRLKLDTEPVFSEDHHQPLLPND